MTDYRIDCSTKDGPDLDYRLDGFGGIVTATGRRWYDTLDNVIAAIDRGDTFWVSVNGRRVDCYVATHSRTFRRYLTTVGDSYPPNNLLNLPNCR